jgi:hypothetical protein
MSDALSQAKHRLTLGLDREPPVFEPLIADQWVIKSLLQKSIRRGEIEVAQRAALTFLAQKGSALWRRFVIIAFEDIGAGSADDVAMTVAASTDGKWRKQSGGDIVVAAHLARLLAEAPKSRSAEHLITGSNDHPSLEQERRAVSSSSIADNLATVPRERQKCEKTSLEEALVRSTLWRPRRHLRRASAADSLSKILEAFIARELQPWLKTFPSDFYQKLFRLRGMQYPNDTVQRPRYSGLFTNDIVYDRLAPGVLDELRKENPRAKA